MPTPRSKYYGDKSARERNNNLIYKYGITLEEWNQKFEEQDRCCGICGSDEPRGKNWHTDHNHENGQVRSILCGWCNTGLGKFQEDPTTLLIASVYSLVWNFRSKNGKQDLEKAIHCLELLIEFEYGEDRKEGTAREGSSEGLV